MKLVEVSGIKGYVLFGGSKKLINLALTEGLKKGDYVLVHAGYAIERVKPSEAKETLALLNKYL